MLVLPISIVVDDVQSIRLRVQRYIASVMSTSIVIFDTFGLFLLVDKSVV